MLGSKNRSPGFPEDGVAHQDVVEIVLGVIERGSKF
jgi:hypothetical protein